MDWKLQFISQENLIRHVKATIDKYGEKLESFDIVRFNKNIIDPVKMIFDKTVYQSSWEEIIGNEIFRQRDKSNNNDIGYFHQRIFQYISGCHVPDNGTEGGWDVVFKKESGIDLPEGDKVGTIYVEMKNKHNTMNSSASGKTYIKMQNQLLNDDDCACFLVEAIAKKSQNIKWSTTVDGRSVSHRRIRRVSMDQFYALVTGQEDAFYQICMVLPSIISQVIAEGGDEVKVPHDSVYKELKKISAKVNLSDEDIAMALSIYLLGFSTYSGFSEVLGNIYSTNFEIKRIQEMYEFAKSEDIQ